MMNRIDIYVGLAALLTMMVTDSARAGDAVPYSMQIEPHAGGVVISIDLPRLQPGPQAFVMPRAIPMGYGEAPYDSFVEDLKAFSPTNQPLAVERASGSRWRLGRHVDTVQRVTYTVNVRRMEQELLSAADASKMRVNYVGLLGHSVFGYIDGLEQRSIELTLSGPPDWPVLTTLAPQVPPPSGQVHAKAANFYALADSQIAAGPALKVRQLVGSVPLILALYSEGTCDADRLGQIISETMDQVIAYFGSAPFSHYTVHYELLEPISDKHEYGFSMEHLDSCTMFLDAKRAITANTTEGELFRTRYNLAHHFAHAWIPKRACGVGYYPFTWERAPILDTIWLSEGFVQYAAVEMVTDDLPPAEAGATLERLINMRFRKPLSEAPAFIRKLDTIALSREASTKYSEDFRYGRNIFSRGALMALEMDQFIRKQTEGHKRFRDVMRHMMVWSARERRGFRIDELTGIISEETGVDTSAILQKWLATPQP